MKATRLLLVIAILQALTLVTLWKGDTGFTSPAHAALPEPGADRKEMVSEMKAMNDKLASMLKLMESGKLQVVVAPPDDKAK